jgi:hypothetical protein
VILTANRVDQFLSNTGSFSGSFNGVFTGSLFGTASWAQNVVTASYSETASYVNPLQQNVLVTGSLIVSASGTTNDFRVGTNKLFVSASGNVGIGTTTPTEKLDVSGKTKTTNFQMTSGSTNGYVLTSDANGNAAWQAASGGGITVGTTAITSGTDGRVFFQSGSVVQQDSAFFWDNTNKRLGVGATPASTVRLDVRAQGALYTDIAFRIRNSANTQDLVSLAGDGSIAIGLNASLDTSYGGLPIAIGGSSISKGSSVAIGSSARAGDNGLFTNVAIGFNANAAGSSGFGNNSIAIGPSTIAASGGENTIVVGSQVTDGGYTSNIIFGRWMSGVGFTAGAFAFGSGVSNASRASLDIGQSISFYINQNTRALFLNQKSNLVFRNGQSLTSGTHFDANATNTFTIHSGTAPSTNITDAFQQYSADITAGNAAPHFRTENGAIVKVYQETTAVGASTLVGGGGTPLTDTDTFDGYTLKQIVKALRNQGLLS